VSIQATPQRQHFRNWKYENNMKRCPRCGHTYTEEGINFCLNDGELLSRQTDASYQPPFSTPSAVDDSPPTMVLDQARVTNPIGWSQPLNR
jgi:hypothetical protein